MTMHLKRGTGAGRPTASEERSSVFASGGQTKQLPARPKVSPSQPKPERRAR